VNSAELDQLVAQIGEQILARVSRPALSKAEGLNIPGLVCPGCTQRCPQTCSVKTKEIVAMGADRVSASERLTKIDSSIAPALPALSITLYSSPMPHAPTS
jgi:hypothetical protein